MGFVGVLLLAGRFAFAGSTVEVITVHGKSLEGNLSGDPADRSVSVYLPPGYASEKSRRYPVVYLLHGFTDSDEKWFRSEKHWIHLQEVLDKAIAAGAKEMIVVMPNAFTRFQGSMYSNSVTVGDWETFVARELVAYIDSRYRTVPNAQSRGLAGHSMGGYGTLRIGMKFPDVFSSIYALSPCCLGANLDPRQGGERYAKAAAIRDPNEIAAADFGTKAALASGAAWSPNPSNGPLFLDLPWKNGEFQPEVAAKWAANAPLAMIDQYIPNLKRLKAIAADAGDKDVGIAATVRVLDAALARYGIAHFSEIYEGNHVNGVAGRIEKHLMPFFSKNLF